MRFLQLQVAVVDFVPRQPLLVQLFHEWIGIELLDVVDARFLPQTLTEHHGTNHGGNTRGVGYALHARLLVGSTVRAVVIDIIGVLLAIVANATDAAADRGLAFVVLAQILRVGQYGLQELQGHNLYLCCTCAISQWSLVLYLVNATHADVLNYLEVLQILLAEGHPETGTLDGGVVDD